MFTRRKAYHPYKPPTPRSSPAGRIVDYINPRRCFDLLQGLDFANICSPDPSPLSSPVKGPRQVAEGSLPSVRFPGHFSLSLKQEKTMRSSAPAPNDHQDAPKNNNAGTAAKKPAPPPRKAKRGPKHHSFTKRGVSGAIPPHRRAQQFKEKREALRKRIHQQRAARVNKSITSLRKKAQKLMKPENMNDVDRIFLEQLKKLDLRDAMTRDLEQCREQVASAAAESHERRKEHRARDEAAAKTWGERQDKEASVEQQQKVETFLKGEEEKMAAHFQRMEEEALRADEARQRTHAAHERKVREEQERLFREELARLAKEGEERRKREELARKAKAERARRLAEERRQREKRAEEERKRQMDELMKTLERMQANYDQRIRQEKEFIADQERERRRTKAQRERQAREERERVAREERERQARVFAEQLHQHFTLYERKWDELRTNNALPPIQVWDMPWPVFAVVSSAEQITYEEVRTFLFHPQRPGVEGKTARDKVKAEVLRFHPDKFNTRILPKIHPSEQAVARSIAGAVARILTRIMTEEVERQN